MYGETIPHDSPVRLRFINGEVRNGRIQDNRKNHLLYIPDGGSAVTMVFHRDLKRVSRVYKKT